MGLTSCSVRKALLLWGRDRCSILVPLSVAVSLAGINFPINLGVYLFLWAPFPQTLLALSFTIAPSRFRVEWSTLGLPCLCELMVGEHVERDGNWSGPPWRLWWKRWPGSGGIPVRAGKGPQHRQRQQNASQWLALSCTHAPKFKFETTPQFFCLLSFPPALWVISPRSWYWIAAIRPHKLMTAAGPPAHLTSADYFVVIGYWLVCLHWRLVLQL